MKLLSLILLFFTLCFVSCSDSNSENTSGVLAQVGDKQLYYSDIENSFTDFLNKEDSVKRMNKIIDTWIETQLIYEKALLNIPDKNGKIQKQIESFKQDIYIHKYEQLLMTQNLDTIITNTQIDEYYNDNKDIFVLRNTAVKPIFIIFPNNLDLSKAKKWFSSRDPEDLDKLQDFTFQFSPKFYFSNLWLELPQLLQEIPVKNIDVNRLFSTQGLVVADTLNTYFVRIPEFEEKGKYAPVELVSDQIAKILLHKRRVTLVKNMRNKIYQDALHKKQFEIF